MTSKSQVVKKNSSDLRYFFYSSTPRRCLSKVSSLPVHTKTTVSHNAYSSADLNDDEISSVLDDEVTLIEGRDCLKLKNSIHAFKYLDCSTQDISSIVNAIHLSIITAANEKMHQLKDDSFASFNYQQENPFSSDSMMLRKLKNFYSRCFIIQESNESLVYDDEVAVHDKSFFGSATKKNVRFSFEEKEKKQKQLEEEQQQKAKSKHFDFLKLKCFTCTRSDTIISLDTV